MVPAIVHGGGCRDVARVVDHLRHSARRVTKWNGSVIDASRTAQLAEIDLRPGHRSIGVLLIAHGDGHLLVQEGNPSTGATQHFSLEWWLIAPPLVRLICFGCKTMRAVDYYSLRTTALQVTAFEDDILLFDGTRYGHKTTRAMMEALIRAWVDASADPAASLADNYRTALNEIAKRVRAKRFWNPLTAGVDKAVARLLLICIGLQADSISEG